MADLTLLCVSKLGDHARPFIEHFDEAAQELDATFVLAVDRAGAPGWTLDLHTDQFLWVRSDGYIESVLDDVIAECPDGYILRMDDDERISPPMQRWLAAGAYRQHDHWAFPRMHLWPDAKHYIVNDPLYPDLQTRLSVKAKAGGRRRIHVGSPFGTGTVAPVEIEHHKFLVRERAERERLVETYDRVLPGAGEHFKVFSVPEQFAGIVVESVS